MMRLEPGTPLTPTEREALFHASHGLSDAQIGRKVGLTTASARTYMHRVRSKLAARNRADAVRIGFELGYLTVPEVSP
jgi:DNA-binding CsgD family transcriptional regulator